MALDHHTNVVLVKCICPDGHNGFSVALMEVSNDVSNSPLMSLYGTNRIDFFFKSILTELSKLSYLQQLILLYC